MKTTDLSKYCVACGHEWDSFVTLKNHHIVRCPECGLGHTLALSAQKGDYHRDEVYIQSEERFANIFQRRINLISEIKKNPGKILDIGSSTGLMLSLFQKMGWQVQGIEMSNPAAEFAKKRNIPTLVTTFEHAKLEKESFDAVIMNHTLEHVLDASAVLKKIAQILKPRGIILIDVPNFGSWAAQHQKANWPYLLPNEHVWHFTNKSLEKLLAAEGLEVVSVTSPSGIWDYAYPLVELWQSGSGLKKRFLKALITLLPDWIITQLHKGTSLTIVAQKK